MEEKNQAGGRPAEEEQVRQSRQCRPEPRFILDTDGKDKRRKNSTARQRARERHPVFLFSGVPQKGQPRHRLLGLTHTHTHTHTHTQSTASKSRPRGRRNSSFRERASGLVTVFGFDTGHPKTHSRAEAEGGECVCVFDRQMMACSHRGQTDREGPSHCPRGSLSEGSERVTQTPTRTNQPVRRLVCPLRDKLQTSSTRALRRRQHEHHAENTFKLKKTWDLPPHPPCNLVPHHESMHLSTPKKK